MKEYAIAKAREAAAGLGYDQDFGSFASNSI